MRSKLIIFDCDGVLVDSEIVAHKISAVEMTRLGFPLTVEKSIELFSGVLNEHLPKVIETNYGKSMEQTHIDAILKKIDAAWLKDLQAVEHIADVVDYLQRNDISRCIASNSWPKHMQMVLTAAGLHGYFKEEYRYSAYHVKAAKPAPDLFLHAARQFKIDPADCVVIEDSAVGIQAAKAAGMPVIGFLGASHAKNNWYYNCICKESPTLIAGDAHELLDMLQNEKYE